MPKVPSDSTPETRDLGLRPIWRDWDLLPFQTESTWTTIVETGCTQDNFPPFKVRHEDGDQIVGHWNGRSTEGLLVKAPR